MSDSFASAGFTIPSRALAMLAPSLRAAVCRAQPLSPEDETTALACMRLSTSSSEKRAAQAKLLAAYLPLITCTAYAKAHQSPSLFQDYFAAGCEGLIDAAQSYDPTRAIKNSTSVPFCYWAKQRVRAYVFAAQAQQASPFKLSPAEFHNRKKIQAFLDQNRGLARESALTQFAQNNAMTTNRAARLVTPLQTISLDTPLPNAHDVTSTFASTLADDTPLADALLIQKQNAHEHDQRLEGFLGLSLDAFSRKTLSLLRRRSRVYSKEEKQLLVFRYRFLRETPLSQQELANLLRVSHQRIAQIEKKLRTDYIAYVQGKAVPPLLSNEKPSPAETAPAQEAQIIPLPHLRPVTTPSAPTFLSAAI